ncbi:hypothetical protein ASZ90_018757 [hydrocarbon metagenome]|uniref:Uncharacterized protein n=1 Tax=hydrocarbon metagenome TaxID=938273 RepID=A0A0W8E5E0_9ZZZZ
MLAIRILFLFYSNCCFEDQLLSVTRILLPGYNFWSFKNGSAGPWTLFGYTNIAAL